MKKHSDKINLKYLFILILLLGIVFCLAINIGTTANKTNIALVQEINAFSTSNSLEENLISEDLQLKDEISVNLKADMNNCLIYYSGDQSAYYLLQILPTLGYVNFEFEILENGSSYHNELVKVTIPLFSDIVADENLYAIKFFMAANKEYVINFTYSDTRPAYQNFYASMSLTHYKDIESIKNDSTYLLNNDINYTSQSNPYHIYLGETYVLDITYFQVSGSNVPLDNRFSVNDTSNLATISDNSNTQKLTILVDSAIEKLNGVFSIEILDHAHNEAIRLYFVIKLPYYATYAFDSTTYNVELSFADSYENVKILLHICK